MQCNFAFKDMNFAIMTDTFSSVVVKEFAESCLQMPYIL